MSVFFIIVLILIFAITITIACIIAKLKSMSNHASVVVSALKEGLAEQAAEIEHTPKSINGMTSLCLPRITRDFPAFNWFEFRQKAENMLKSAFMAITKEDISLLTSASDDLHNQVSLTITANRDNGRQEVFQDIQIHQTEIADYRKMNGTCVITLQTAVGYYHYIKEHGTVIDGSMDIKEQTRYNIELQYIQDTDKIAEGETAVGTNCPNCGAPITSVGEKTCPYCGLAVTEININTWALNRYAEV